MARTPRGPECEKYAPSHGWDVVFLALFVQHLSEHEDSEYVGNSPIVAQSGVSGSSELAIDVGLGGYLGGAVRSQQARLLSASRFLPVQQGSSLRVCVFNFSILLAGSLGFIGSDLDWWDQGLVV